MYCCVKCGKSLVEHNHPNMDHSYDEGGIKDNYKSVEYPDGKGYKRNGHPIFYDLLKEMAETHDKKSHDYASNSSPFANYKFAGMMSKVFNDPDDSGFIGRIGEKIYRLANLENSGKQALNESIEDTEKDIATIIVLWMAMRRERRLNNVPRVLPENRQFFGGPEDQQWTPNERLFFSFKNLLKGKIDKFYSNFIEFSETKQLVEHTKARLDKWIDEILLELSQPSDKL